ncbi:MAG: hypothetical protein FJ217_05195 [Ignavibacteria bacterium]|nr:hypothetical protein [Ignavibacteria bacterium]
MGDFGEHRSYPLIPPGELRCIWMTAGILSYQLCDREYDCEHCPLDDALRMRFTARTAVREHEAVARREGERRRDLHTGYQYGRKHTWVQMSGYTSARVGIEPGLAFVLLSPKAVVLPSIREHVFQGRACAWIVTDGGTFPVLAPLDGQVSSANAKVAENPHTIRQSPLDEGWLFTLSTDRESVERGGLLDVIGAAKSYAVDESRFQALLAAELSKGAEAGLTIADGGQMLKSVSDMVGPKKYFRLVREAFG